MKPSKVSKRIKLTWLTICPICGKSHTHLWLHLIDDRKLLYQALCPKTKEYFTMTVMND